MHVLGIFSASQPQNAHTAHTSCRGPDCGPSL